MPMIRATWQLSACIALTLAFTYVVCRGRSRPGVQRLSAFAKEFAVLAGVFAVYQHTVHYARTRYVGAYHNASALRHVERRLHLPSEVWVQHLILPFPLLVKGLNAYYAGMHLTTMTGFMVWLWWRHRDHYPLARNTLAVTTLVCVLVQMIPVAPPRMFGDLGFVDSAIKYGQSMYGTTDGIAGQVGAMPSIHVAWAAMVAAYALKVSSNRWRWLGPGHFAMTVFVVTATANHWWLDGVVGIAILAVAFVAMRAVTSQAPSRLVVAKPVEAEQPVGVPST